MKVKLKGTISPVKMEVGWDAREWYDAITQRNATFRYVDGWYFFKVKSYFEVFICNGPRYAVTSGVWCCQAEKAIMDHNLERGGSYIGYVFFLDKEIIPTVNILHCEEVVKP